MRCAVQSWLKHQHDDHQLLTKPASFPHPSVRARAMKQTHESDDLAEKREWLFHGRTPDDSR